MSEESNYLAGGVNSPIPTPAFFPKGVVSGLGPLVLGANGREYIDLWMGYGALLFGHRDSGIEAAATEAISKGWFFSLPNADEQLLAAAIHRTVPCAESVRFATTGSDAVMYAIRAARAFTRRSKILAIRGGYHGANEGCLPSEGLSPGLHEQWDTITFNNEAIAAERLAAESYAALIVEPVQANNGCTPPKHGYLNHLRELCFETNTILIFDEVVTGFRLGSGGAQSYYNVTPDLCTFSKAIAGGFPLSAVAGRKDIMESFIPTGKVFFAGTFNGHPVSLRAALHVQKLLADYSIISDLERIGDQLRRFIISEAHKQGIRVAVQGVGSMLSLAFGVERFTQGLSESPYDKETFSRFINVLAQHGVLHPPLPTETIFLSTAHVTVMDRIQEAISLTFKELAESATA